MRTPDQDAWLDLLCERQRLDLIGDLTGGLAHELNNALSVVAGHQDLMTEDLEEGEAEPGKLLEQARVVQMWMGRALAVARRLSDVSRQMREDESVAAAQIVTQGVDLCRYRCEREGILLIADVDAGGACAAVPAGLLLQVTINLVQNAREAIARAREVQVSDEDGTIRVALEADGDVLRLLVEDDGPGLDAGEVERIFGLDVTTMPGQAWGCGLPVSRRIARRAGGELRAEPGQGGRFCLEIPRRP